MNDKPASGAAVPAAPLSFAALRQPGFATYCVTTMLAMMADNIEHVISYWVIFEKFKSPALAGFAVLSHWLPFLLFSVYFGAFADRYDSRRIIQVSMLLFMAVSHPSLSWVWDSTLILVGSRTCLSVVRFLDFLAARWKRKFRKSKNFPS